MIEKIFDKIDKWDIAILRVLDGLRGSFEYVELKKLLEKLPFRKGVVRDHLRKMEKLDLVSIVKPKEETYVKILERGLDILSIWNFVKHEKIERVLARIGKGKESEVYSAIDREKNWYVVKLHRYYSLEFKRIKQSLAYSAIKFRGEELKLKEYLIDIPKAKAQVEFHALQKVFEIGVNVPKPIDLDRHAVLTEMIWDMPGIPSKLLKDINLKNPKDALEIILEDYEKILKEAKIVHGDLSEFNIMITKNGEIFYIDWPQAVPIDYENAKQLAERDIQNILNYFQTKYSIKNIKPLKLEKFF